MITVENTDADICCQINLTVFLSSHACTHILTVQHSYLSLFWVCMLGKEVGDFCLNKETNNKSLPFGTMI